MKIDIKYIHGPILFSYDCENNSVKKTLEKAVAQKVDLSFADLKFENLFGIKLRGANLYGADLQGSNLCNADLYNANLSNAILFDADLSFANLDYANLVGAYLDSANLTQSKLYSTNLSSANLYDANLYGINIYGTNLYNANLSTARNIPYIPMVCPSEGAFIGWKKVNNYLVKLLIPEDAKRSSATTNKCRCDKAKVLEIIDLYTKTNIDIVINDIYVKCIYKVNEMVYPDKFDENRWDECSHGIHFFINKQEAINY